MTTDDTRGPIIVELPPIILDDVDDTPLTEEDLASIRQLGLTSCDFVGDSGCCDPNCWQCHSPIGPENLRRLAKNLAAAAMLCRAHHLGFEEGMDTAGVGEGYPSSRPWTPGCRRSTP